MKIHSLLLGLALGGSLIVPTSPAALAQVSPVLAPAPMPLLHPLFSDNAVLQRDRVIPIWGWSTPGQPVTVAIDGKKFKTRAEASGRWMVRVGPYKAGGPHLLTVDGSNPAEMATRQNILFGDVWLCSGQSNMEMGIGMVNNAQQEIASANYPAIRLFTVPKSTSATPKELISSEWLPCNPTTIAQGGWGGFSATAYFFGRKLHQELNVPIGLIHSSWGGTIAEAWVRESSLGPLKDFDGQIASLKATAKSQVTFELQMNEWFAANDAGTKAGWEQPTADETGWQTLNAPGNWEDSAIPELKTFDGLAWYRREVEVPANWAGKDLTLRLGGVDDSDTLYWNGAPIGQNQGWNTPRAYRIPGAGVKVGRNIIALRVLDTGGGGGINGNPDQLRLELDATHNIPLAGPWKIKISAPLAQLAVVPQRLDNPNIVTVLNNAMIAPLTPYAFKGAIWYQGESNAGRAAQYGRLLPTLINDWRDQFHNPFPFHIVQLAGYMAPDETPRDDAWPRLREAQMHTAQTVKNTGIAVTVDIGDEKDIHPKDKQDVGLRLALSALAQDYGKKIEYSGPTLKSAKRKGETLVLTFDHAKGGLKLQGDANRVFALAGADGKWFWATPQVDGSKVVLSAPEVKEPVNVRYAWSNLPRASLYNGAGLPASPFRTDKDN